jgi:hypothetical protein
MNNNFILESIILYKITVSHYPNSNTNLNLLLLFQILYKYYKIQI